MPFHPFHAENKRRRRFLRKFGIYWDGDSYENIYNPLAVYWEGKDVNSYENIYKPLAVYRKISLFTRSFLRGGKLKSDYVNPISDPQPSSQSGINIVFLQDSRPRGITWAIGHR